MEFRGFLVFALVAVVAYYVGANYKLGIPYLG